MNETLIKDNGDVVTFRNTDQRTIIKISNTEQGLILLANEARWLHHLNESGFTPRLLMDEPGRIVMQDLGENQEVFNLYNFRRNAIFLLHTLRLYGVKHGDLTAPNIIIKNDRPMAIDWGEAVELGGTLPSKRPEPDATHLWAVVADNKDTTRFASRWFAIREAYGEKEALELLAAIKAKCGVLFFESQLAGDGPGPDFFGIKGDVAQLLSYLPGVGKVEEIVTIPVAGRDAARTVFMVS